MFSDIINIQRNLFIAKLNSHYIRYCTKITAQMWSLTSRLLLNTGVGSHFLHQGIFLTQEYNLHLLHWQADSLSLRQQGRPVRWLYPNTKKQLKKM